MTIEEMKARKAELGYTNETVAELSGVPLGTVQKIFAGETKSPRYDTVRKLVKLLEKPETDREDNAVYKAGALEGASLVMEPAAYEYNAGSRPAGRVIQIEDFLKPPKKTIGIANGKFRIPPDELLFDDEISGMFEDI